MADDCARFLEELKQRIAAKQARSGADVTLSPPNAP
jgi:hypothetical protein